LLNTLPQLEDHVQHAIACQASLGSLCAMADRGEGGFNWIASTDALLMLRREVEECHEFLTIFLQA